MGPIKHLLAADTLNTANSPLTSDWTEEGSCRKYANRNTSIKRLPEIYHRASNNSERRAAKETAEESTEHDCLDILRDCDWYLENREYKEANEERNLTTENFLHSC